MSVKKKRFNKRIKKRKKLKINRTNNKFDISCSQKQKNVTLEHNLEEKLYNNENFTVLKTLITQIFIFFLLAFPALIIIVDPQLIVFKYKEYKVGQYVTINNNNWYVIKDSDSLNDSLMLLSEYDLDLNKDGKIDNYDKIDFPTIKELFNSDIKARLNIGKIQQIRLLKSEEYISIREEMNFGYDWTEENWLAGESKGKWWLDTKKYGKIFAVTSNGTYNLDDEKDKNFVRVVIEILKFNLK